MTNKLNMTFGYTGTDFTRDYAITKVDDSELDNIKGRIKSVNESLAGGTSDGLDTFFIADDYDGTNGKLSKIVKASIVMETEEVIYQ